MEKSVETDSGSAARYVLSFGSGSILRSSSFLELQDKECRIAAFGRRAKGILTEILRNPGLDFTVKPAWH